jgi:hypothetical protein
LVRGINTIEELPVDLDRDIIAEEGAKEFDAKGLFTKALPSALVASGSDIVTYEDLAFPGWVCRLVYVLLLILRRQNPQCEDTRTFFDEKASEHVRVLYKVCKVNNQYVMDAGAAHGITDGAQFIVYKDQESIATRLGITIARQTDLFSTTLDIISDTSHLPEEGYALRAWFVERF